MNQLGIDTLIKHALLGTPQADRKLIECDPLTGVTKHCALGILMKEYCETVLHWDVSSISTLQFVGTRDEVEQYYAINGWFSYHDQCATACPVCGMTSTEAVIIAHMNNSNGHGMDFLTIARKLESINGS